jgi:NADH-quinone oxidoreductase subunit N
VSFTDALITTGPALVLLLAALVVVFMDLFIERQDRALLPLTALTGVVLAGVLLLVGQSDGLWAAAQETGNVLTQRPFFGALVADHVAVVMILVVLVATALAICASTSRASHSRLGTGEYYGLILTAAAGMVLLAMSHDFLTLIVAFETMSIATYILAASQREDLRSNESGLKYFVQGAFATGIMLFGIALYYGATGSLSLGPVQIMPGLGKLLVPALALLLIGLAFKIGAAPFQVWIPDVYQGAPTAVTGFMATGVKAAAFAILYRVVVEALPAAILAARDTDISLRPLLPLFWTVSALTMVVGNFAAIRQRNLKRMLAYSGIAHTGYLMMLFAAWAQRGAQVEEFRIDTMAFYLLVYAVMTLGAFGVLTLVRDGRGRRLETFADIAGLARRQPWVALAMTIFMVSLAGLPPMGGFLAKFMVFREAVRADLIVLAVLGIVTSIVSLYYYLLVPVYMYMYDPDSFLRPFYEPHGWDEVSPATAPVIGPANVAASGEKRNEAAPTMPGAERPERDPDEVPGPAFEPDWGARFVIYGGAVLTVLLGIRPDLVPLLLLMQ